MTNPLRLAVAAAWLATAAPLLAETPAALSPAGASRDPVATAPSLVVGLGAIGVEPGEQRAEAVELQLRLPMRVFGLQPTVGGLLTAQDSSYGWLGFGRDFPFAQRWVARIDVGAGYYEPGEGKELGQSLEFRTGFDLSYQPSPDLRLGLQLAHLSNAGLSDINPGTETLTLSVAWSPRR